MNSVTSPLSGPTSSPFALVFSPQLATPLWWRAAAQASPLLTRYAATIALLMIPTLLALLWDARELRGVSVWLKPFKFLASISLFAFTTALCMSLLPEAERRSPGLRRMEKLILWVGSAELAYIIGRAALGQASHFNFDSLQSSLIYPLMGIGALALTATQGYLALRLHRAGPMDGAALSWHSAVVWGLWLTAILNAVSGGTLGSFQPPAGSGSPLFGWHLSGGDLRPAHFLGLHALQFFLLAGCWLARQPVQKAFSCLRRFALVYVLIWAALMGLGLYGAKLTVSPFQM